MSCFFYSDEEAKQKIIDQTETNMVALKRTIYLTIQSSLDFEECAHKLMKMDLKPGQEVNNESVIWVNFKLFRYQGPSAIRLQVHFGIEKK